MEERKTIIKSYENSFMKYITEKIYKNNLSIIKEEEKEKEKESEREHEWSPLQPVGNKQSNALEYEHPNRIIFQKEHTDEISENSYDFFCTNGSSNLSSFLVPNDISNNHIGIHAEQNEMNDLHTVCIFDHDVFDVTVRIIPDYYINKTGIKVGAFNFNFYNSIIDSIRNMRILSEHQLAFIENCTRKEYQEIINEYNKVIKMLYENDLNYTDQKEKWDK